MTTTISHQKMFGIYLHALILHAPPQYEIMCMKSANSEHEERLFGQAKNMVQTSTNRHPTTVIPNILLRLQARQKKGTLYAQRDTSSRISKENKEMQNTATNTTIPRSFLLSRMSSWQAHLIRISPFLSQGKDVWWQEKEDGYEFLDGSQAQECHAAGPPLRHYRSSSLHTVYTEKEVVWKQITEKEVELPTPFIKIYDSQGEYVGLRTFSQSIINREGMEDEQQEREEQVESKQQKEREEQMEDEQQKEREEQMEDGQQKEREEEMEDEQQKEREEQMEDEQQKEREEQMEDGQQKEREEEMEDEQQKEREEQMEDEQQKEREEQMEDEQEIEEGEECIVHISAAATEEDHNCRVQSEALQTKLCHAILRALGEEILEDLTVLDHLRHTIKNNKNATSSRCLSMHKQLVSKFRQKLVKEEQRLQVTIKNYECKFYRAKHCLPHVQKDEEYRQLTKSKRFVTKLLSSQEFTL